MCYTQWIRYEAEDRKPPEDFSEFLVYHYHCGHDWRTVDICDWISFRAVEAFQSNDEALKSDMLSLLSFAFSGWTTTTPSPLVKEIINAAATATVSHGLVFLGGDVDSQLYCELGTTADDTFLVGMWHAYECGYSVDEIISNCIAVRKKLGLADGEKFWGYAGCVDERFIDKYDFLGY